MFFFIAVRYYYCQRSMLELVAAFGKLFFHNRPSEVTKKKRTIYCKLAMRFSICWQAVFCLFRFSISIYLFHFSKLILTFNFSITKILVVKQYFQLRFLKNLFISNGRQVAHSRAKRVYIPISFQLRFLHFIWFIFSNLVL